MGREPRPFQTSGPVDMGVDELVRAIRGSSVIPPTVPAPCLGAPFSSSLAQHNPLQVALLTTKSLHYISAKHLP